MDVCYLINKLAPAGAETLVRDLVRRGGDNDFTVCSIEPPDGLVADLEAAGARVVTFDAAFKFDPRAITRCARFFRREEFDIVHAHLPYAQTLGRLGAALGGHGAVVSTQHDYPGRYHPITRRLEQATRPLDDATVAVSQAVERAFTGDAHVWPDHNGQWTTIHNGVDVDGFARGVREGGGHAVRKRHGIDPSAPLFLSVGRYVKPKNQPAIIRAFAQVHEQHPESRLLLVGHGPERDTLEWVADARGVTTSVIVTGRIDDVAPYYAAADVFVSASHSESFGLALVEAMAAGLSVVGPDVRGAREVLAQGDGVAVSPTDPDAIAAAMQDSLGDPTGDHRDALETFDIGETVGSHHELYRDLTSAGA